MPTISTYQLTSVMPYQFQEQNIKRNCLHFILSENIELSPSTFQNAFFLSTPTTPNIFIRIFAFAP